MADSTNTSPTENVAQRAGTQQVGVVYAKALLAAAEKSNEKERVLEELTSFVNDVLAKLPKFEATLTTPRVGHEEKVQMLDKGFGGSMCVTLLNFLKVVSRQGRLNCLRAMEREAHRLDRESRGVVEVLITTAAAMERDMLEITRQKLQEKLGAEVELKTAVDPTILGGITLRVGDTVYDGSLVNRLNRLRAGAIQRTAQEIRASLDRFAESAPK